MSTKVPARDSAPSASPSPRGRGGQGVRFSGSPLPPGEGPGVRAVPGGFPARRMRRLRRGEGLRRLVRETRLEPGDFLYPLFIAEALREPAPIAAMPEQWQWPLGQVAAQAE